VIVDGLEIFGFNNVRINAAFSIQSGGDVADHVFDKLRVVVGAFGDVFFVRALEQAKQLAGSFLFN